jgi:hypothetical protein
MYTSARSTKARPKDSTLTLINGNEISNSKAAERKARHSGSFSYLENQITLAALDVAGPEDEPMYFPSLTLARGSLTLKPTPFSFAKSRWNGPSGSLGHVVKKKPPPLDTSSVEARSFPTYFANLRFGNTHVTCHVGVSSCGQRHRNALSCLITF